MTREATDFSPLRAAVQFVLLPETWPVFAAWARSLPADSEYAWSDPDALREDLGLALEALDVAEQMAPALSAAMKMVPSVAKMLGIEIPPELQ